MRTAPAQCRYGTRTRTVRVFGNTTFVAFCSRGKSSSKKTFFDAEGENFCFVFCCGDTTAAKTAYILTSQISLTNASNFVAIFLRFLFAKNTGLIAFVFNLHQYWYIQFGAQKISELRIMKIFAFYFVQRAL